MTAPIIGVSKTPHSEEAVKTVELTLSREECRMLEEPHQPHPVLGHS